MSEQPQGGYRPPARPAPASGPGRLSKRTDGQPLAQLPDAAYGEQKTYQQQQKQSPMAQTQGAEAASGGVSPVDMSRITPLGAPSQYPDEPVTSGADAGAGPGMGVLGTEGADPSLEGLLAMLPTLEIAASAPNASRYFKSWVRLLRSKA